MGSETMNGEREAALVLQDHLASHNQHDLVLWLAAENECLRRALRNDRETIASLRGQLRCAHNALRTLHTQGAGSRGQDTVEEHHRYLIAQLSNLDRLALDWARRSEELAAESRELCQLRVEHAQVLEASQALRKAHEATINSLQSKLDSLEAQYTEAESTTISLRATCKELSAQMAALSKRPNVSQRDLAVIELETDGHIVAIEAHIQDTERLLSSLECAVPPRLHQLLHQVAEGRTAISKESDARKQRDSQVKHLMKLIRDLEERNGQALKKLEAVEEERISMQLSASDSIRKLEEKDLVIQHLDLQCEAYERELKSSKGARAAGNLRQSVPMPLGVSNVENRQSKRESPRLASMPKAKTKTKTAAAPRSKCPGAPASPGDACASAAHATAAPSATARRSLLLHPQRSRPKTGEARGGRKDKGAEVEVKDADGSRLAAQDKGASCDSSHHDTLARYEPCAARARDGEQRLTTRVRASSSSLQSALGLLGRSSGNKALAPASVSKLMAAVGHLGRGGPSPCGGGNAAKSDCGDTCDRQTQESSVEVRLAHLGVDECVGVGGATGEADAHGSNELLGGFGAADRMLLGVPVGGQEGGAGAGTVSLRDLLTAVLRSGGLGLARAEQSGDGLGARGDGGVG